MKTLVFNFYGSTLDQIHESLLLRMAYLLTDQAVSVGTSGSDIYFETYNPPTVLQKMKVMDTYWTSKGTDMQLRLDDVKRTEKAMRKIKHLDKEGIVLQKKFEKSVDNLFAFCKTEMLHDRMVKGLPQLLPLCDGTTFGFYPTHYTDQELEYKDTFFALSKILSLEFPEEDLHEGHGLFLLPPSFRLYHEKDGKKFYSARDREAGTAAHGYFDKCFSFGNLNGLNAVELKAVREQLSPLSVPFRKSVDEWMRLCYEAAAPEETVRHFRQQVQISAAPLLDLMRKNEVLERSHELLKNETILNLWLGEVPAVWIWEFFRAAHMIHDKTWEKLMKIKDERQLENKRWPVLAMEIPGAMLMADAIKKENKTIAPVKKSLSMD